jgi:DNA-binding SARP family transcriptional activator
VIGVRVLGPVEVTVDGAQADLGGPRQRCVLARLIAARGQVVSADRLIEDLYADEAPPRALAAVQSYVSHLRRALEPGRAAREHPRVLITSPPGYAFRLDAPAVDAWSFEEEAHQAAGLGDPAAVHSRLGAALSSWRGAAYEEFAGLPWADLEASRLEELRLMAIEQLAEAALQLGRAAQVVVDLSRLTAEHPLREEAWRLLALALYQSGRQGDALAALRRARGQLAAELGVDPGPALRQLEEDVLAHAPALSAAHPGPSPARLQSAPGRALQPDHAGSVQAEQFVGRDAELAMGTRSAAEAAAGSTRIILVSGDAGAGKTALAGQLGRRLAAQGWTVTTGRCPEHEGAPPGWPWAEALRRLARTIAPSEPRALAAFLTDDPPPDGDVAAARFRLHRAVAGYLEAVGRSSPLLVVLDDVHRADGETLAILQSVTADLSDARVLVLATYRPAEVTEQLSDCLAALAGREPTRVALGGLDPAAAGELIRATCARTVDSATVRVIAERTEGNPFFIRETARLLDSEGALAATTEVPAGVSDVLRVRIARLPATAQTVLRQAAIIGTEAEVDVLADVADVGEDVLVDAIEAGLFAGLVTEPAPGRVRFAHALVRETLYQSLSRLHRARLHARAAAAIEKHAPGEVAALAHHFTEAGTDPASSARYCRLAAEQAEQRFAYHEAAGLWERATACLDQVTGASAEDRLDLVLHLVRALAHTGNMRRARSYRREAVEAALLTGSATLAAQVITEFDVPKLWYSHEYGATDDQLIQAVEQTLSALPPGDHVLRCRLLSTLAFELEGAQSDRGDQASGQALEMARRLGDPAALTLAINGRYIQSFRHDGLAERASLGAELLALPGKPVTVEAVAHLMIMMASGGAGDFETADRHADQAAQIADRFDLPMAAVKVLHYRAMHAGLAADPAAAYELYQEAATQMDRFGMWAHGTGMGVLGRFCIRTMHERAAESIGELESFMRYPRAAGLFAWPYALALAASGRVAEARAVASALPAQLAKYPAGRDAFWLLMTSARGLVAIAIDDHGQASSAYEALLPYSGRPAGSDTGAMTLWPVDQILGDLGRYLGLPNAQAHYRAALAMAEHADAYLWVKAAAKNLPPTGH